MEKNITRPLEVIETEINFYKQQTATGIIEIGKRLIEAKEIVGHGGWINWLENKVDFSRQTANKFMRIAEEYLNVNAPLHLGSDKLFKLLDVPSEDREDFITTPHTTPSGEDKTIEEMTTREVEKAVKEWKKKVEEKDSLLLQKEKEYEQKNKELELKLKKIQNEIDSTVNLKLTEKEKELEIALKEKNKEKIDSLKEDINTYKKQIQDATESKNKLIKEKEDYRTKYTSTLSELDEKNKLVTQFMGESTNFGLIKNTSEITLSMINFVKDMSKYDYLSEVFNEIPDATRKEYVRSIYGVYKWAKNILNVVKCDDVIGVNKNYIEVNETNYKIID